MIKVKKIIKDYNIFTATLEVRRKCSILSGSCGILINIRYHSALCS
ncbi:hypothetical protein [Paraclostridium sordellii]|nr:hypothetical protein [Paeniclostridium sordellii]QYE99497.1 hypothetical protein KZ987_08380 [Paeniclostridium sordellii]